MTQVFDLSHQAHLVARCRSGDAAAIAELYEATVDQVYAFAYGMFRRVQDAEDVTSETYLRAIRGLPAYRSGDVPIVVWLVGIARNVAHEQLRARNRNEGGELTPVLVDQLSDGHPSGDDHLYLAGLLPALTPAQREVIALRLAGFKLREIAAALGKSEGTVKALQFAALRNLRKVAAL